MDNPDLIMPLSRRMSLQENDMALQVDLALLIIQHDDMRLIWETGPRHFQ